MNTPEFVTVKDLEEARVTPTTPTVSKLTVDPVITVLPTGVESPIAPTETGASPAFTVKL